ncbi:MAG: extracellular solute-binding protein [Chloroflexi bacterium]|nr:extracellular solute-binding protein [Chloroflexota bacterium]
MKMKTVYVTALLLLVFLAAASACVSAGPPGTPVAATKAAQSPAKPAWQEKWDRTVEAARAEGAVLSYSILAVDSRQLLSEAFKARFGITLEFVSGLGGELAVRLTRERDAGIYNADAITAGGTTFTQVMKPAKLLGPIEPLLILPEVTDPKLWNGGFPFLDKDKTTVAMIGTRMRYILRNTEMVKESEITSYKDVLKPQWKGKIVMADPLVPGAGSSFPAIVIQVYGMDEAKEFFRQVVKQEPVVTRDWRQMVEWVARGKYPIGLAPNPEQTASFLAAGAPIATVKVNEGAKIGSVSGALGVPARVAHPNASIVFINWLLSKEGQEVFAKGLGNPSRRTDVSTSGINPMFLQEPGEKYIYEDEEHYNFQTAVVPISREIFGPLLK